MFPNTDNRIGDFDTAQSIAIGKRAIANLRHSILFPIVNDLLGDYYIAAVTGHVHPGTGHSCLTTIHIIVDTAFLKVVSR